MEERKSQGKYAQLVGEVTRIHLQGDSVIGVLSYTDYQTTELLPHVVGIGNGLENRVRLEIEKPEIIMKKVKE